MDKYTGSEKLRIAHFPSLSKPNNRLFFTITTGIKGTVAYFAFTHLFIDFFCLFFIDFFFQKHSIYGVAPGLSYSK